MSAVAIGLLTGGGAATIILPPQPRLVWNASASAPIGLYLIVPDALPDVGEMVIAQVPERVRRLAARRGYIPAGAPLVKRVVAVAGDRVCAHGHSISINDRWTASRRATDGAGRPMPWWNGCYTLGAGAIVLLMDNPGSFDGRYFGPTRARDVIGRAHQLSARP
ncbi:S26 family signal peptidase [Rhizorhabdus dicambivorans]|uniref:S26 family signal peptidase n=1 Tax=Rhizorhabdus dicambivorans TaxID=1850238 RepID=UPI001EE06848|nr:S26 family signal peptidase [Rhizorhabdus dicambivorans]